MCACICVKRIQFGCSDQNEIPLTWRDHFDTDDSITAYLNRLIVFIVVLICLNVLKLLISLDSDWLNLVSATMLTVTTANLLGGYNQRFGEFVCFFFLFRQRYNTVALCAYVCRKWSTYTKSIYFIGNMWRLINQNRKKDGERE